MKGFIFFVCALVAVCSAFHAGGSGQRTIQKSINFEEEFKLTDPSIDHNGTRRLVIHLQGDTVMSMKTKIGTTSSCTGSVNGLTTTTYTDTRLAIDVETTEDTVYVCVTGQGGMGINGTLSYTVFLGTILPTTASKKAAFTVKHTARDIPNAGHVYQMAVPICGLTKVALNSSDGSSKTITVVPLTLRNIRRLDTNAVVNLKTDVAMRNDFKELNDKYMKVSVSSSKATIEDPNATSYNFKSYTFSQLYASYTDDDVVQLYATIPDSTTQTDVIYITFHVMHCGAIYGACPESFSFDVHTNPTTVPGQGNTRVDENSKIGTVLPALDETVQLNIMGNRWCPYIIRNNLEFDTPSGVTPAPRRYFLWSNVSSYDLDSKKYLSLYSHYASTSSNSVRTWDEMYELPGKLNDSSGDMILRLSPSATTKRGYAAASSLPSLGFTLDVDSSDHKAFRPHFSTWNYRVYLRSMVGYMLEASTPMNGTKKVNSWNKYALNVAQEFLERLDASKYVDGDQFCVTFQCDASEADCVPAFVFQDAKAEKSAVTATGVNTHVGSTVGATTYCFEKGETSTHQHGFLLPMNGTTHKWMVLEKEIKYHIDDVMKSTGSVDDTGFKSSKIETRSRQNIEGSNKHSAIIRIPLNADIVNALAEDKQLTLSATMVNELEEPQLPTGWTVDIRASQFCPRAGDTCESIVSKITENDKEKFAIASGSLRKEFVGDSTTNLKYPSLYVAVIANPPSDFQGDFYVMVNGTIEEKSKDTDVIDDGSDTKDPNDIDDVPDNDNNDEKPEPTDETKTDDKPTDDGFLMKKLGPLPMLYWIAIAGVLVLAMIICLVRSSRKKRRTGAGNNTFWNIIDAGDTALA